MSAGGCPIVRFSSSANDMPVTCRMPSRVRLTGVSPNLGGGPWDYIERIEITDRTAYDAEIATLGKDLISELYEKYLDKSKTKSIWTKLVDP